MKTNRNYSELIRLKTFEERYSYLKLNGKVGKETFGNERYLNQLLYKDPRWLSARDKVIIRDNGCDLGIDGREIFGKVYVHHMNPMTIEEVLANLDILFDPDFLICTSFETHNAIHYGDVNLLLRLPTERSKNDMCPWKGVTR